MADLVAVLNTIRANSSPTYQDRVPLATRDNITAVGNPLLTYSASMNEFLTNLINRIALTICRSKELKNPLAVLKQGIVEFGADIQETFTEAATATDYNGESTDLLAQSKPSVKVAYHRLNRQSRYCVTLNEAQLRQAFVSYKDFQNLINTIVATLYNGNYADEFLLAKNIFGSSIANDKMKKIEIPLETASTFEYDFVKIARTLYTNFNFNKTGYNSAGVLTRCEPEDIRFIIRSDIEARLDVDVMAKAFHLDRTQLLGQMLIVDDFGVGGENCTGIIMDKSFTQIYDNFTKLTSFENGSNLTWNYYFHKWQTYSVSPFANAVALVTPVVTP